MTKRGRTTFGLALAAVALTVAGCAGGVAAPAQPPAAAEASDAESLMALDGAWSVTEYEGALTALGPKCLEPDDRLAALAFGTQQVLAEAGVDESLLSILRSLGASIPPELGETNCQGVLAGYVVLRTG